MNIYRDIEIKEGQNWAKRINVALQEADILLVIFTDRMKIKSFLHGIRNRLFQSVHPATPERKCGLRSKSIFLFVSELICPNTMHDIQGVSIGAGEVYKVLKTKIESGSEPVVDEDHPVFKLLAPISDLVMQTLGTGNGRVSKQRASPNKRLHCIELFTKFPRPVSSETYPERKLIIRTSTRPVFRRTAST